MPAYKSGLRLLCPDAWEDVGRSFVAILIDDAAAYAFDVDDAVVTDIAAAEVTATGYARVPLSTLTVSWDAANDRWRYHHAAANFGPCAAGADVAGVVYAEVVTDDTDSPLIVYAPFNAPEATDDTDFIVTPDADGAFRVA